MDSKRSVWFSDTYQEPIDRTLQKYLDRNPPPIVPDSDGRFAVASDWPPRDTAWPFPEPELEDTLERARDFAISEFQRFLESDCPQRLFKCNKCQKFFALARKPREVIQHGSYCKNCKSAGGASRVKTKRNDEKKNLLKTAADAWVQWKHSHLNPNQREWVAEQVSMRCRLRIPKQGKWVSRNLKRIRELVEENHHALVLAHRRDGIYTRPDAPGYWGSWTSADGRRIRRRFKVSTLEQAKIALAAARLKVEEQIKFGKPLPSEDSFAVFASEFLDYQKRRISPKVTKGKLSQVEYDRQEGIVEKHLKPFFGQMRLAAIRRKDVAAYINSRMGIVGDGTIIKEVNVLETSFQYCNREGGGFSQPYNRAPGPESARGPRSAPLVQRVGQRASVLPGVAAPHRGAAGEHRDQARRNVESQVGGCEYSAERNSATTYEERERAACVYQ